MGNLICLKMISQTDKNDKNDKNESESCQTCQIQYIKINLYCSSSCDRGSGAMLFSTLSMSSSHLLF